MLLPAIFSPCEPIDFLPVNLLILVELKVLSPTPLLSENYSLHLLIAFLQIIPCVQQWGGELNYLPGKYGACPLSSPVIPSLKDDTERKQQSASHVCWLAGCPCSYTPGLAKLFSCLRY